MRNPIPCARWFLRWELRRLRTLILRLRRREGSLSFRAEQGGPHARRAFALAAALQCVLSDHLVPASEALEVELTRGTLLPEPERDEEEG